MKQCAIALIDALGFRGIWQRKGYSAERVLQTMQGLREDARRRADEVTTTFAPSSEAGQELGSFTSHAVFLSDTIVLANSAPLEQLKPARDILMLGEVCARVMRLTAAAAMSATPLVYRGCIVLGEAELDEDFIIGPAVDEAAELFERCQGAIVWFAPSAKKTTAALNVVTSNEFVFEYEVPLTGGGLFRTSAVNPFHGQKSPEVLRKRMLDCFDASDINVLMKRQNTGDFLDRAIAQADTKRVA